MSDIDQKRIVVHLKSPEVKEAFLENFTLPDAGRVSFLYDYEFEHDQYGNKWKRWNPDAKAIIAQALAAAKEGLIYFYSRYTLPDFEMYGGDVNSLEYRYGYFPLSEGKIWAWPLRPAEGDFIMSSTIDGMLVTEISPYAFKDNSKLRSITLSDSITKIGQEAFRNCTGLTSITLPSGLTEIDRSAFNGCSSLIRLTIPEGVTKIEYAAFAGCTNLEEIHFPNSLISLGGLSCAHCKKLKKVTFPSDAYFTLYHLFISESVLRIANFQDHDLH